MSERTLREALHHIAERAPDIDADPRLFDRGRSAAARGRVLLAAAAVLVVAIVGAVGWQALRPASTPVAEGPDPTDNGIGVPDTIYAAPDGGAGELPTVRDWDDVAPVVASYVAEDVTGEVVLVSADGRYRRTTPEGITGTFMDDLTPTLSPDGTRLAYAWADDGPVGIAILDLTSGEVQRLRLVAADVLAQYLQWSPDSTSLVWAGQVVRSAHQGASGSSYTLASRQIGGVVTDLQGADGAARTRQLPDTPRNGPYWKGAGICDDGAVVTDLGARFEVTGVGSPPRQTRKRSWGSVLDDHDACAAPTSVLPGDVPVEQRVLGWVDGSAPTAVVQRPDIDEDGGWDSYGIYLLTPEGDVRVASFEAHGADGLSVATGPMTVERPTVSAGDDPWATPWWQQPGLWVLLVTLLGVAGLAWWLRRRLR